jgi:hypothetical protein
MADAARPPGHDDRSPGFADQVSDIVDTTKAYARQELLEPVKGLGRFVGVGVAASFCFTLALVLLTIAALRALQHFTGTALTGNWSWVPYLVVLVAVAVVVGAVASRIPKTPGLPPRSTSGSRR